MSAKPRIIVGISGASGAIYGVRLLEDDRRLMGEDWWPYGIAANRHALDTFLRHHHEQGITKRVYAIEELFAPETLE